MDEQTCYRRADAAEGHIKSGSRDDWQKTSTFISAAKQSVSMASNSIGLWDEKTGNGINGYGEWYDVGLHFKQLNLPD